MAPVTAFKPVKEVILGGGGGGGGGGLLMLSKTRSYPVSDQFDLSYRILDLKWRNDEKHQSSENIFTQLHVNKCKETVPSYDFQKICIRQLHEVLKKDRSSGWICPTGDNSHFIGNNFAGLNFRNC